MPKISAVINTRNEEHNIRYCLETVKWCDEIVIVDMESEDRTVDIAREYTNKIYSHSKVLAFDIAKKFAVEKAKYEWILLIDADEMVPWTLATALKALAAKNEVDIVEVPFKHYIMGEWVKHSGWGYTPLPRFFRQGKIQFTETIHSYMHKVTNAYTLRLKNVDGNCIHHFNYIDSAHFIEKLNRYTSIEAQHLFERSLPFSYKRLCKATVWEFYGRFIKGKGYRDGVRGFSLCLMMAFYRALSFIKLWEKYQFREVPANVHYERIKQALLTDWKGEEP